MIGNDNKFKSFCMVFVVMVVIFVVILVFRSSFTQCARFSLENCNTVVTQTRVSDKTKGFVTEATKKSTTHYTIYKLYCMLEGVNEPYTIDVSYDTYDRISIGDHITVTVFSDKKSKEVRALRLGDVTK